MIQESESAFLEFPAGDLGGRKTESFLVSAAPVTVKEFSQFCKFTGFLTDNEKLGVDSYNDNFSLEGLARKEKDRAPAVFLTFNDVQAYCSWKGRRLLTEMEWHVARLGKSQKLAKDSEAAECLPFRYSGVFEFTSTMIDRRVVLRRGPATCLYEGWERDYPMNRRMAPLGEPDIGVYFHVVKPRNMND